MNFYDLIFKGEVGHSTRMGWWENILGEFIGGVAKLIAKFLKIKGNTIVWNQLVKNGNFADTSNWTVSGGTLSVSNNEATITFTTGGNRPFYQAITQKTEGHKVLVSVFAKASSNSLLGIYWGRALKENIPLTTTKTWISFISMVGSGNTNFNLSIPDAVVGETVTYSNVQLFDLTAMFGSTKADEIYAMEQSESGSGVAYFRSLYPLPYYQYNVGSLLSFNGEGIKTVGFNLWDEEWEEGIYNITTGAKNPFTGAIRCKNFIPAMPNTTYYFKTPTASSRILFYDENENFIEITGAFGNLTFKTPSDCVYITFFSIVPTYNSDICINISGDKNGTYESYQTSTSTLPISDYFPTGMKSAGSVYDELTNSKAITRIGEVDLGTLDYIPAVVQDSTYRFVSDVIADAKLPSSNNVAINGMCIKYAVIASGNTYNSVAGIGIATNGRVQIYDPNYNQQGDAQSLKASLSGIYLYYELATPTEVDINPPLNLSYQVWEGGTEQLLPVNTDKPVTTPILADINYPDGERDDQYFTYRQYLPNNQLLGMALNTLMGKNVPFNREALDILMKGE